ncbi:MAG TPA: GerMN domain-containing protein [Pyrinomonadaceae bacterium]
MKRVLLTVLALLVLGAGAPGARGQDTPMAGAYGERRVNDPSVTAAAAFAVRERGRQTRRRVTLLSIRRAETQVVAGLNYRLVLNVREGGEVRDVTAVVFQNLRQRFSLESWEPTPVPSREREVKVYLVALDDNGRRGRKIGCNDSLVPVTRNVSADAVPLKAAVEELLSIPREYEGGLGNYWFGENLSVQSVAVRAGVATIRIRGNVYIAGVCDAPRIEGQIRETARQFRGVRSVRVFVNGRRLADALR